MTEDQNDVAADLDLPDICPALVIPQNNTVDTPPVFDCAAFVAGYQLARALKKTPKHISPGLQLVVAPDDTWRPILAEVAPEVFTPPPSPTRRPRPGIKSTEIRIHELDPSSGKNSLDKDLGAIEHDLVRSRLVIVVAGNLATVPAPVRQAADRTILVQPPDGRCLMALVRSMDSSPGHPGLRGIRYEGITPAALRLACRGTATTPRAFLRRLKILVRQPANTTKATSLDRLHGVDEARRWACHLKSDLDLYRQGRIPWQDLSRGLLLAGPPGTGKTSLAAAIAGHCRMAFIPTSYASWQTAGSGHLGNVLKAMASAFNEARKRAPSLLFIDELDSLPVRGTQSRNEDWWRTIVNAFLEQIDGSTVNEGVVLVAATNDPDHLDPAILRSGRLEDRIDLHPPGVTALAQIYADQLAGDLGEGDLERIAAISTGKTGADVVRICASARRRARATGHPVCLDDLLASFCPDEDEQTDEHQKMLVAIHEIGHALAAIDSPELSFDHVTVLGQGDASGGAVFSCKAPYLSETALDALLSAILAGRAAEEIILGDISSGSGGREGCDLSKATQLAVEAQLSLGIHSASLVWYPALSPSGLAGLFTRRPDIEKAVQQRLDRAYARAKHIIQARAPLVRRLAEHLLLRKAMTADDVMAVINDEPLAAAGTQEGQPCMDPGRARETTPTDPLPPGEMAVPFTRPAGANGRPLIRW